MDKTIIEKVKGCLESHPDYPQCFITSDGQVFLTQRSASQHSKGLDDKQIFYVSRDTNLEDWFDDIKRHEKIVDKAHDEFKSQDLGSTPKWGWWNWLYKFFTE